ncbi:D-alanyl-D-alanine carboxypeptidase [uncultured Muriicola sp.]|uniref:D-alanyl-D-alanine carboxypeptidase/D-alanyl-D-alanine-endopeptidase n=1 Tax=uncultured Muriicola sp. TaxID=1583102 RepID=UPI00261B4F89|nr:D-alanyl-D-alanine carboxypeptidase [uncultured Muriicola sp.]
MKYTIKYQLRERKVPMKLGLILLIFIYLAGCASQKERRFEKKVTEALSFRDFDDHFTGLMIYDPITGDTLIGINSDKYFTPASNTKIFTLYTSLKILPDSIPALKYVAQQDTLYFTGTGDPSALHPYFQDSSSVQFLTSFKTLVYVNGLFGEERFGPGWAWEDYDSAFSPERSALPLYGNVITILKDKAISVIPEYFKDSVRLMTKSIKRVEDRNTFYFDSNSTDTIQLPFKNSTALTKSLLEGAVGASISLGDSFPDTDRKTLYSISSDSLYRYMMQDSDNFIAEQLLIIASSVLTDTLSGAMTRDYILDTYLAGLPHKPRWVDGSGLSRYNLFTPGSMIYVLKALYKEIPRKRLFTLFPSGGISGTLEEWYSGDTEPYVFAKSGTLGNNYCLSGYLITKKGKTLIFSFMNNHFMKPTSTIKTQIEQVLETIRDSY